MVAVHQNENNTKVWITKLIFAPIAITLQLFMMAASLHMAQESACLVESIHWLVPRSAVMFYIVAVEGFVLFVVMWVFWISALVDAELTASKCETILYIVLLAGLILTPLGIMYMERGSEKDANENLVHAIKNYGQDDIATLRMDYLQSTWFCCGIHDYRDWQQNANYSCSGEEEEDCYPFPKSCEGIKNNVITLNQRGFINGSCCPVYFSKQEFTYPPFKDSFGLSLPPVFEKGCALKVHIYLGVMENFWVKYNVVFVMLVFFHILVMMAQKSFVRYAFTETEDPTKC